MEVSILKSIINNDNDAKHIKNNKRLLLLSQMTKINSWVSLFNLYDNSFSNKQLPNSLNGFDIISKDIINDAKNY
jgi:hypothetical protein